MSQYQREVAAQIDEFLKKNPVYEHLAESGKLPAINEFSSSNQRLETGQRSDLIIKVSDPEKSQLSYRIYPDSGSINFDKARFLYYYRASNKTGPQRITLYAINQRNLLSESKTVIEVG